MQRLMEVAFKYANWIVGLLLIAVLLQLVVAQRNRVPQPRISDEQFAAVVDNNSVPVLVKFGATWCPPCRTTDIALSEFEKSSPGKAKILVVDVDANRTLADRYSVSAIPHSFLFFRGKVIDDRVGGMDVKDIDDWLDSKLMTIK